MKALDDLIDGAAGKVGLPPDLMRMAICLLSSYPFSAVLKRIPDNAKLVREIFCVSCSAFYLLGVYHMWGGLRTLMISTLGCYFITKTLRTNPFMPWINFMFVMTHLFINHIDEQFHDGKYDVNTIDITGAQMVLCMKLTAFGWNVYDGLHSDSSLSEFQRERAVKEHPPLLDFITYSFFFPSLFTGPAFDYKDFARWIDLSMFDSTVNDPKKGRAVYRRIPRSGLVSAKKAVEGVLWIGLWTQITRYVDMDYATSEEYKSYNFFMRLLYMYGLGVTFRLKYYGAWSISEGACILSGLGFNGKTKSGKYRWDRLRNVNPMGFETAQNAHSLLASWNMNTNQWLRNYIYLRVTPKGRKPGFSSTLATFFTSAAWHGTRPGYYLMFVTGAFYQSIGKDFRRNIRPIFLASDGVSAGRYKRVYDLLTWVVTQVGFGYMVQPFILLDLAPAIQSWKSVYFAAHVGIALTVFLFHGPFKKQVVGGLKRLQPTVEQQASSTPIKPSDKIKMDSQRLREIRRELGLLQSSQPVLGVPNPDFDRMDDDIKDAIAEFDEIKGELIRELDAIKAKREEHSTGGADKKKDV